MGCDGPKVSKNIKFIRFQVIIGERFGGLAPLAIIEGPNKKYRKLNLFIIYTFWVFVLEIFDYRLSLRLKNNIKNWLPSAFNKVQ